MKKIILFLMLLPIVSFSAIDECKTDVYFANGILTKKSDAKFNTQVVLEPEVISLYTSFKEYKQHIGKIALSYNKTKGFWLDGIETYLQKFGLQSLIDLMNDTAHKADLKTQIDTYKASIKSGHKVLVVAHSQGNLFTNEVYKKLLGHATDWWMTRYFKVVSIASPMCFKITPSTPGISWGNDVVPNMVGLCSAFNVENNVRKVSWEFYDGTPRVARPNHNYIYKSQVGEVYENSWKGIEEGNDENVHAFTFYMGEPLKEGDKNKPNYGEIYLNPFDDKNITNDTAKDLIMTTIKSQIDELEKLSSQWKTDQEFDKNTCDYKITLKHQYDPSIEMAEKVYPFNASKKLYQVNGEWVKASCGGTHILDQWDGKKDNECWMIDNVEEEKIGRYNKKYIFRIRAAINIIGTCNQSLQYPIHIKDRHPDRMELSRFQQYGEYDYGDKKIINLSTSFMADNYSECVTTLKGQVVSIYNVAQNIVNEESIKIDRYLKNKFPTASISYGKKDDYFLEQGCHHADISPGQREDLGYQCLDGFIQKAYIEVFE